MDQSPAQMVPVFHLAFAHPVAHRFRKLKTRAREQGLNTETSRVVDCGRAIIDYHVREPALPGQRWGKVVWRTEIAAWMQLRHAEAMGARFCKLCWPEKI